MDWNVIKQDDLGPNLKELINSTIEFEKKIVLRDEYDDIMVLINRRKNNPIENFNFIWYQKKISNETILKLNENGYRVFNPQRGINYGKTWPGYKISW